jgi:hypothetical protein
MPKYAPWYDPTTEKSRFLEALSRTRHLSTRAEETVPYSRQHGSVMLIAAIRSAIDDYAEHEMGHREYFWDKPHSAGCKHS